MGSDERQERGSQATSQHIQNHAVYWASLVSRLPGADIVHTSSEPSAGILTVRRRIPDVPNSHHEKPVWYHSWEGSGAEPENPLRGQY